MAIDELSISAGAAPQALTRSSSRVRGPVRQAFRTTRGRVGASLVAFVVLVAAIGPAIAPDSSTLTVTAPLAPPSSAHLLGTDVLGRDVLSRMLDGGWQILLIAAIATVLGIALGATVGIIAAFEGKRTDAVLMRAVDVLLAFPQLVLALMLVSIIGAKTWLLVIAVAIAHAPQVARVMRSAALDVCERDFVKSAQLIAMPRRRVMFAEILPNLTSPLMVESGLRLTFSIIVIAGLSFLGFGLQPPSPNWGAMINENRIGLYGNPWGVIGPAILLALLTVGMSTFTDAIARVSLGVERPRGRRSARRIASRRPPATPTVASTGPVK